MLCFLIDFAVVGLYFFAWIIEQVSKVLIFVFKLWRSFILELILTVEFDLSRLFFNTSDNYFKDYNTILTDSAFSRFSIFALEVIGLLVFLVSLLRFNSFLNLTSEFWMRLSAVFLKFFPLLARSVWTDFWRPEISE